MDTVGLVLSGGGARGAYEMGALSVLLPALEDAGQSPRVIVGTSIGAINAAFLASFAELDARSLAEAGRSTWLSVIPRRPSLEPLLPGVPTRFTAYVCGVLGIGHAQLWNVLDPTPLGELLQTFVPLRQIAGHIPERLEAVAVVATSALTGRSVVFHQGGPRPDADAARGIEYVDTPLTTEHVRASAALPGIFPAVEVRRPAAAAGWYWDGGTRLNTPIKPALALGAQRVVVIGLNSIAPGPRQIAGPQRPDAFAGLSQLLQGMLVDSLVQDLATLTTINEAVAGGFAERRLVPYIFVAPRQRDAIGRLAQEAFVERYGDARAMLRSRDATLLGRAVEGQLDPIHGELLSMLLFDERLMSELFNLGAADARAWVRTRHSDGLWETGPLHGLAAADWAREGHPVHPPGR